MPPAARAARTKAFLGIFDLGGNRLEKVLGRMEAPERKTLERTLDQYAKVPPGERERLLEGFDKYSRLSPAERAEFLSNAARWKAMSAEERMAWKRLVLRLPPPPALPPPFPPGRRPGDRTALAETNRN
jgi:hypothetical protein